MKVLFEVVLKGYTKIQVQGLIKKKSFNYFMPTVTKREKALLMAEFL